MCSPRVKLHRKVSMSREYAVQTKNQAVQQSENKNDCFELEEIQRLHGAAASGWRWTDEKPKRKSGDRKTNFLLTLQWKRGWEKKSRGPLVLTFFPTASSSLLIWQCYVCVCVCLCALVCVFDAGLVPVWLSKGAIRSPYWLHSSLFQVLCFTFHSITSIQASNTDKVLFNKVLWGGGHLREKQRRHEKTRLGSVVQHGRNPFFSSSSSSLFILISSTPPSLMHPTTTISQNASEGAQMTGMQESR